MHNPRSILTVAIAVFALVVGVGAFSTVSVLDETHDRSVALLLQTMETVPYPIETPIVEESEPEQYMISGRHVVRGDTHRVFGEVMLSVTCEALVVEADIRDTEPSSVELIFTTSESDEDCLDAEAPTSFDVAFDADAEAILTASWNGHEAVLSLLKDIL